MPWQWGVAAGVDLDRMLADVHVVSIVQRGALDAQVVDKSAIEAVQILNDHASCLVINLGVVIGHGEVIHWQIVIRCPSDGDRAAAHRHLFDDFVIKHEAELRHLNSLQRCH